MNGAPKEPPVPPLQPVESSHLSGVAHDIPSKTLYVGFHDGSVYAYAGVSEGAHQALVSAKSPGEYFNQCIKGQFRSAKVRQAPPKAKPQ